MSSTCTICHPTIPCNRCLLAREAERDRVAAAIVARIIAKALERE